MPGVFDPTGRILNASVGAERRCWIHERAQKANLSDTQYLCKLIDEFKSVIE